MKRSTTKENSKSPAFTHLDERGRAQMVDVGGKTLTHREAVAEGIVHVGPEICSRINTGTMTKGDVFGVARVAGILAAKKVHELIPLAHPVAIDKANLDFLIDEEHNTIIIRAIIGTTGKTGVEMEALTAVSIAALTIYDMCKAITKEIQITDIVLLAKKGGKSGDYLLHGVGTRSK